MWLSERSFRRKDRRMNLIKCDKCEAVKDSYTDEGIFEGMVIIHFTNTPTHNGEEYFDICEHCFWDLWKWLGKEIPPYVNLKKEGK